MENATNLERFSKLVLNRFLIHFVPGIVLYFGLRDIIHLHLDRGLLEFIVVCSFSWTLGLILEIIFFKKIYKLKNDTEPVPNRTNHYLLISKVGLAIVMIVGANILLGALEILQFSKDLHPRLVILLAIKTVVFGGFGLFLFLFFKKTPQD